MNTQPLGLPFAIAVASHAIWIGLNQQSNLPTHPSPPDMAFILSYNDLKKFAGSLPSHCHFQQEAERSGRAKGGMNWECHSTHQPFNWVKRLWSAHSLVSGAKPSGRLLCMLAATSCCTEKGMALALQTGSHLPQLLLSKPGVLWLCSQSGNTPTSEAGGVQTSLGAQPR